MTRCHNYFFFKDWCVVSSFVIFPTLMLSIASKLDHPKEKALKIKAFNVSSCLFFSRWFANEWHAISCNLHLCLLRKQSRDKPHDFQMFGFLIAARSFLFWRVPLNVYKYQKFQLYRVQLILCRFIEAWVVYKWGQSEYFWFTFYSWAKEFAQNLHSCHNETCCVWIGRQQQIFTSGSVE